jgi:Tn3 transposase DDE domain
VSNAVVLWTTKYIDAAVAQLRAEGHEISDEDVARLSPLKFKNLNVLGRYSFTPSTPRQGLRPLRDLDAPSWTRTTTPWTDCAFRCARVCHHAAVPPRG